MKKIYVCTLLTFLVGQSLPLWAKETLCLNEPAYLHSSSNKVQGMTADKDLFLILGGTEFVGTNIVEYPLNVPSQCYKAELINKKTFFFEKERIESSFYKLYLDEEEKTYIQAEKRSVKLTK